MDPKKGISLSLKSTRNRKSSEIFADEPIPNSQQNSNFQSLTTPARPTIPSEDEDSPYFPCSTQELNEEVDVLWDWNSPQSKPNNPIKRKSKKRLILQNSPKVPLRRHPSNSEQIRQGFSKLREELMALKADIAKPDHEESLVLSPREEHHFKSENDDAEMDEMPQYEDIIEEPPQNDDFDDVFNDDMEDQLIMLSQQVENEMLKETRDTNPEFKSLPSSFKNNDNTKNKSENFKSISKTSHNIVPKLTVTNYSTFPSKNHCFNSLDKLGVGTKEQEQSKNIFNKATSVISTKSTEKSSITTSKETTSYRNNYGLSLFHQKETSSSVISKTTETITQHKQVRNLQDSEVFNDSFDNILSQMEDEDFDEQLTQVVDIKQCKNDVHNNDIFKAKVFPRSQSEEIIKTNRENSSQNLSGKVEWHRTQSFENYNATLPKEKLDEIEKKRLEAMAKRVAKRKQETVIPTVIENTDSPLKFSPEEIEMKRKQALEKLEAKRQQEIIKRNREEALKRLEERRKKNAAVVKSSLNKRL